MDQDPLRQLLDDAGAAVGHELRSQRRGRTPTGVWPAVEALEQLCASLADTPDDQRGRFRSRLSDRQRAVLGSYGGHSARVALRERSPERLRVGLIAIALADTNIDSRDLMMGVAVYLHVARELGLAPAQVFDEAAAYANHDTAEVLRVFGRRTDVILGSSGWPSL